LYSLKAVIITLNTALSKIGDEAKVYIVNNNPIDKTSVEKVIKDCIVEYKLSLDIHFIHRDEIMPPVYSWYGAISDYSNDGDLIFLHGDDDLFLKNGIRDRIEVMNSTSVDILISNFVSGLVFNEQSHCVIFRNFDKMGKKERELKRLSFSDLELSSGVFIGNNCYRYTDNFKKALKLAFEWCSEQDWLNTNIRTHMLPLYLPLAAIYLNLNVYYLEKVCVIRGVNLHEVLNTKYCGALTNSGFVSLLALGVMNNKKLLLYKELDKLRNMQNKMAASWFFSYFFGQFAGKEVTKNTFFKIGYPKFDIKLLQEALLFFIKSQITYYSGLRNLVWHHRFDKYGIPINQFLHNLQKMN
jgi:hypothetical protein